MGAGGEPRGLAPVRGGHRPVEEQGAPSGCSGWGTGRERPASASPCGPTAQRSAGPDGPDPGPLAACLSLGAVQPSLDGAWGRGGSSPLWVRLLADSGGLPHSRGAGLAAPSCPICRMAAPDSRLLGLVLEGAWPQCLLVTLKLVIASNGPGGHTGRLAHPGSQLQVGALASLGPQGNRPVWGRLQGRDLTGMRRGAGPVGPSALPRIPLLPPTAHWRLPGAQGALWWWGLVSCGAGGSVHEGPSCAQHMSPGGPRALTTAGGWEQLATGGPLDKGRFEQPASRSPAS